MPFAGEPVAGPAESGLDLVRDEHDPVLGAELGQPGQEPVRRHHEPAFALDRLDDHRGHVVLADLGVDQRLDHVQGVRLTGFRAARPAQRIGHRHPVDLAREWPELVLVRHVLRGEGHGQVGAPVVAVVERDDGLAPGGVPGDLHRVLDRLRAGVEQRGALLVSARRATGQFLAHRHVTLVRGHHEAGVRESAGLLGHPRGHPGGGVADRDHRDPGAEVDE